MRAGKDFFKLLIVILYSVCFFFLCCLNISAYPDYEDDLHQVGGDVESLTLYKKAEIEADSTGDDGKIMRSKLSFHPETGALVNKELFDKNGHYLWNSKYSYNEDGLLVDITTSDEEDNLKWRYTYSYNSNNQIEREHQINAAGNIERSSVFQYDKDLLTEEAVYNSAGILQWSKKYTYHSDESIEWETIYPDGNRIKKVREIYNSDGLIIRVIQSDEIGNRFEDVHFVYGDNDQLSELRAYSGFGRLKELRKILYNSNNDIYHISKELPEEDKLIEYFFTHKYDINQNWFERQSRTFISAGNNKKEIVEAVTLYRDITYADN